MYIYLFILLVIISVLVLVLVFKSIESFTNYSQNPNVKDVYGNQPYIYNKNLDRISTNFYSPKIEISNEKMNKILEDNIDFKKRRKYQHFRYVPIKEFKYDYYSGFSGNIVQQFELQKILMVILDRINQTIINKIITKDNYLFPLFLLISYQLVSIKKYEQTYKMVVLFDLYRFDKYSGFQTYSEFIIDQNDVVIVDLNVIGNPNEDSLKIYSNQTDNENINSYKSKSLVGNSYLNENYNHQSENNKITLPIKQQVEYLQKKMRTLKNVVYDRSFMCINSEGNDLHSCISDKDINGKSKKKGIWDRPCLFDSECPFYKANKNTKNTLGGCIKGTCQMPLGVKNVGYHFYSNLEESVCHNCKDKDYCCLEQLDREKYPNLKSPDYAFKNDQRLF